MQFGSDVKLNDPAFIHPSVVLYGKIRVEQGASIWCNAVGRAENYEIVIGPYTNIQDFSMLHVGAQTGTYIGSHCSITHHCTIHGCTIGDNCLIGINATVADGAVVGNNCIIGQHAFVREGQVIPDNSVAVGVPAKVIRTQNNYVRNRLNAFLYYRNALAYAEGEHREWDRPETIQTIQREIEKLTAELAAMEKR